MELQRDRTGRIHYGPLQAGGYQASEVLPVIFRKHSDEVCAYFPTLRDHPSSHGHYITCYAHIGQHGSADPSWLQAGRPATPEEYADLLVELRGIYEQGDEQDPPVTLKVYRRAGGKARVV